MTRPLATSAIRVFVKSMHMLAAGWLLSIGWLWLAQLQQHVRREGVAPSDYGLPTVAGGVAPAALVALAAIVLERWTGQAPTRDLRRREWQHAFWWSIAPNILLLISVYVMIQEGR